MGITSNQEKELQSKIQSYANAVATYNGSIIDYELMEEIKGQLNRFITSLVEPEKKIEYVYSYSASVKGNSFVYSGIIRTDEPVTGPTQFAAIKEQLTARHRVRISSIHSFSFLGKHEIG